MSVYPTRGQIAREIVRAVLPKERPRRKRASLELRRSVIAEIRSAMLTVAQGARLIGCDPKNLHRQVWEETKRDVFARDLGCLLCGSTDWLDAHHRRARGSGGTDDPATAFGMANLVTLCRTHHNEVETNPDWARGKGLRLDAGDVPSAVPVRANHCRLLLTDDGSIQPAPERGDAA